MNSTQARLAAEDIRQGLVRYELWAMLGWHDIKQRYRRSMLGPWWLTLSTGFTVLALAFVYHSIFAIPLTDYLPFLATGLTIWTFLSTLVIDACSVFVSSEQLIKQIRLPFTVHVCRTVWRNLLIFAHNLVIVLLTLLAFKILPGVQGLVLFCAAIALFVLNGIWLTYLLGAISARYRDIPPIVASVMQLLFFVTPIIWHPSSLPGQQKIYLLNPLYHFIELARAPLLGSQAPLLSWSVVAGVTAGGWLITFAFLIRYRRRIAYWV